MYGEHFIGFTNKCFIMHSFLKVKTAVPVKMLMEMHQVLHNSENLKTFQFLGFDELTEIG